jgi:hypothetical protein
MASSDLQSAPTATNSLASGHDIEDVTTEDGRASLQNQEHTTTDTARGRPTLQTQEQEHRPNANSQVGPSYHQSQPATQPGEAGEDQTRTTSRQQDRADLPEIRITAPDAEPASPRQDREAAAPAANDDRVRLQGFRYGDLVIDMFLTLARPRVQDTPVYRVVGVDPEAGLYRLQLYYDPRGTGAMLWTWRNWAQIRLSDLSP